VLTWTLALVSVVAISLVSLIGVLTLSMDERRLSQLSLVLVSFAVGALLGDAFIHLIPASFERSTAAGTLGSSLLVLSGMLLFFVVEKLLRHLHGPIYRQHHPGEASRPELAVINVIGDGVHNFIDGVLVGASYLASPVLGLSTTVAVLLHEIPQELGDFGILIHSGLPVRRAILVNLASASAAILGTIATLVLGTTTRLLTDTLIPITAGGFVYIAAADLVPELQHDRSLRGLAIQTMLIAAGILVMASLTAIE
jgi:zinc and cadmium transporter